MRRGSEIYSTVMGVERLLKRSRWTLDLGSWFCAPLDLRIAIATPRWKSTKTRLRWQVFCGSVIRAASIWLGSYHSQRAFRLARRWKVVGIHRCYVFSGRPGDIPARMRNLHSTVTITTLVLRHIGHPIFNTYLDLSVPIRRY